MSKQILVVASTYCAFAKEHVCYCSQDEEERIWAEGAVHELCNTAYIKSTEMVHVDEEEFQSKHYKKLQAFNNYVNTYENGI